MWFNIGLGLSIQEVISCLQELVSEQTVYISFNTTASIREVELFWQEVLKEGGLDFPFEFGPHFVDEGLVLGNQIEVVDEINFLTSGEKIIWYIAKYPVPEDVSEIVFLGVDFKIDPLIVQMKDKEKRYTFKFIQRNQVDGNIKGLLDSSNMKLQRIRESS